jgi:regulator of protease activity HflC (stomatin/prohibitin superfamily)
METTVWIFVVVAALLAYWFFSTREAKRVTLLEHETGIKYVDGKFAEVLSAGRHATWPGQITIVRLDTRDQTISVPGQEVLTADKVTVRASLVMTYRVADARTYQSKSTNPYAHLYQAAQVALRERVALRSLDDLLADRGGVTDGVAAALDTEAKTLGLGVSVVRLLDLTLVGAAKQAYADLWKAQKEGLAALERARGEQAALRALANAARMLKGNPELMNLRLLQALAGAPGKAPPTIVLGGGGGLLPVQSSPDGDAPLADAE